MSDMSLSKREQQDLWELLDDAYDLAAVGLDHAKSYADEDDIAAYEQILRDLASWQDRLRPIPACGHSACRQYYIESGDNRCIARCLL